MTTKEHSFARNLHSALRSSWDKELVLAKQPGGVLTVSQSTVFELLAAYYQLLNSTRFLDVLAEEVGVFLSRCESIASRFAENFIPFLAKGCCKTLDFDFGRLVAGKIGGERVVWGSFPHSGGPRSRLSRPTTHQVAPGPSIFPGDRVIEARVVPQDPDPWFAVTPQG
jgi:hypothetical protein